MPDALSAEDLPCVPKIGKIPGSRPGRTALRQEATGLGVAGVARSDAAEAGRRLQGGQAGAERLG